MASRHRKIPPSVQHFLAIMILGGNEDAGRAHFDGYMREFSTPRQILCSDSAPGQIDAYNVLDIQAPCGEARAIPLFPHVGDLAAHTLRCTGRRIHAARASVHGRLGRGVRGKPRLSADSRFIQASGFKVVYCFFLQSCSRHVPVYAYARLRHSTRAILLDAASCGARLSNVIRPESRNNQDTRAEHASTSLREVIVEVSRYSLTRSDTVVTDSVALFDGSLKFGH